LLKFGSKALDFGTFLIIIEFYFQAGRILGKKLNLRFFFLFKEFFPI